MKDASKYTALAMAGVALVYACLQGNEAAIGTAVLAILNWFFHPPISVASLISGAK